MSKKLNPDKFIYNSNVSFFSMISFKNKTDENYKNLIVFYLYNNNNNKNKWSNFNLVADIKR